VESHWPKPYRQGGWLHKDKKALGDSPARVGRDGRGEFAQPPRLQSGPEGHRKIEGLIHVLLQDGQMTQGVSMTKSRRPPTRPPAQGTIRKGQVVRSRGAFRQIVKNHRPASQNQSIQASKSHKYTTIKDPSGKQRDIWDPTPQTTRPGGISNLLVLRPRKGRNHPLKRYCRIRTNGIRVARRGCPSLAYLMATKSAAADRHATLLVEPSGRRVYHGRHGSFLHLIDIQTPEMLRQVSLAGRPG